VEVSHGAASGTALVTKHLRMEDVHGWGPLVSSAHAATHGLPPVDRKARPQASARASGEEVTKSGCTDPVHAWCPDCADLHSWSCGAGVNGAGKTTQLQIILGKLQPDDGEVIKAKRNMKIAYLAQVCARCALASLLCLPLCPMGGELHGCAITLQASAGTDSSLLCV